MIEVKQVYRSPNGVLREITAIVVSQEGWRRTEFVCYRIGRESLGCPREEFEKFISDHELVTV